MSFGESFGMNLVQDPEDLTLHEAIQTIYEGCSGNPIVMKWNHYQFSIYKCGDVAELYYQAFSILNSLRNGWTKFKVGILSSVFTAQWEITRYGEQLEIEAVWYNRPEGFDSEAADFKTLTHLAISVDDFTHQWLCLLFAIQKDLETVTYVKTVEGYGEFKELLTQYN